MLETLHDRYADRLPVYGMHRGTVGFLMNDYPEEDLPERLDAAVRQVIHPLEVKATRFRRHGDIAGDQRGVAAAPDRADGQTAHCGRRQESD